jgi:coenzyme F420-reducing hydrogenase gamma subunit
MSGHTLRAYQLKGCDRCIWHLSTLAEQLSTSNLTHNLFEPHSPVEQGDVIILSGYASNEDIDLLKELRNKASRIILYGTCPHTGGIFGLENQRGGSIIPVSKVIPVDFTVTGCPPNLDTLKNYLNNDETSLGETLCKSCERTFSNSYVNEIIRVPNPDDTVTCFNNQGIPCSGVVAGQCSQRCIDFDTPCRGCIPNIEDSSSGMLGYFTSLAGQIEVDTRATEWTTDMLGEQPDTLTAGLPDIVGTFFRFTLASDFLQSGHIHSSGDVYTDIMLGRRIEEAPQIAATIYGSRGISVSLNLIESIESSLGLDVSEQTKSLREKLRVIQDDWAKKSVNKETKEFAKIIESIREFGGNELLSNVWFSGFKKPVKGMKEPHLTYASVSPKIEAVTGASEDKYSSVSVSCDENGIIREWSCELR